MSVDLLFNLVLMILNKRSKTVAFEAVRVQLVALKQFVPPSSPSVGLAPAPAAVSHADELSNSLWLR